jgi:hypothetical protein
VGVFGAVPPERFCSCRFRVAPRALEGRNRCRHRQAAHARTGPRAHGHLVLEPSPQLAILSAKPGPRGRSGAAIFLDLAQGRRCADAIPATASLPRRCASGPAARSHLAVSPPFGLGSGVVIIGLRCQPTIEERLPVPPPCTFPLGRCSPRLVGGGRKGRDELSITKRAPVRRFGTSEASKSCSSGVSLGRSGIGRTSSCTIALPALRSPHSISRPDMAGPTTRSRERLSRLPPTLPSPCSPPLRMAPFTAPQPATA